MKLHFLIFFLLTTTFFCVAQSNTSLQQQATIACEKGDFKTAVQLSEKALNSIKSTKNSNLQDVLILKSENASYYVFNNEFDKGIAIFNSILENVELTKYPKAQMYTYFNYGIALLFIGSYSDALIQLTKAYDFTKTQKMNAKELVTCLSSLAVCYQYKYNFVKAESYFKEAESSCIKQNISNSVDYASLLSNFALLYVDMQLPIKAKDCYEKAETIFLKTSDTLNSQFPVFLLEYGALLADCYQFEKALNYTYRAKNLDKILYTENSSAYASDLNNLGYIYSKLNKIIETEQFYTSALKLKKSLPNVKLDSYLTTLNNLVAFYCRVGRNEDAKELVKEIEEGLLNKNFTDTMKRATFANNLGIHYKEWGDTKKSIKYFTDALIYYKTIYGDENVLMAELYVDMSIAYIAIADYTQSTNLLNKAADIYLKNNIEESVNSISLFCNLAIILKEVEKLNEANDFINKAVNLTKKFNVTQTDILEQVYISKAEIASDLNDVKESMNYFNQYLNLKYAQIEQNFSYMTENEKLFFLEEFEKNIKNFYTSILNQMDKYPELINILLDFRLKTKALLLNNLSKIKQQIIKKNEVQLTEKFEDLKLKRETISKLMNFNTDEYPIALSEAAVLKTEADNLEKQISLQVSLSNTNNNTKNINWQSIQKNLLPNEVAIEIFQCYLMYNNNQGKGTHYSFIIIKPSGDPILVSIDRPINWENEVLSLYRLSIDTKKNEPDLYRRLWKLVDEKIANYNTIYLSPDGIYNELNLNTLFNAEKNNYLIDYKNIHLITTLNDIKNIKQSTFKIPTNCVLFGNPTFDFDIANIGNNFSTSVATRNAYGFVLSELPGTKQEVNLINNTLTKNNIKCTLFTEENANESNVKKIKNPDVLHIATHGFFLEDVNDEDLTAYSKFEKEYYKNPMMRSGIFFSGANKTYSLNTSNYNAINEFEDGTLTAYEAMNLNLDKTELVVLSACQTGLGKVKNGEGVYGLQRAFKLSGAKSIIMSLWPVSDEATRDLMIAFYDNWTKNGNLYKAFKDAQLEIKKKYPEPYYWGAFILNGK